MTSHSIKTETGDWQSTAQAWARAAWNQDAVRQNGVYHVQTAKRQDGYCVVYSNHPYIGYPLLRAQELTEIRRRLKALGIPVLAYATHPHARGGYSDALLVGVGRQKCVERLVNRAMDVCWSQRKG
jgi:hypothetical protein